MSKAPFQLNTNPINAETQELAEKELRETPEIVGPAIEKLRALINDDPTIHFRDDDDFLKIFLRPCKFYPESAFALVSRPQNS